MNLLDLYIKKVAGARRVNQAARYIVKQAVKNVLKQPNPLSSGMTSAVKSNPLTAASNALSTANKGLLKKPRSAKQELSTAGRTLLGKR